MAQCDLCGKRANQHHACFYCGRRPMCLKCSCPCRTSEEKEAIVAETLRRLDSPRLVNSGVAARVFKDKLT